MAFLFPRTVGYLILFSKETLEKAVAQQCLILFLGRMEIGGRKFPKQVSDSDLFYRRVNPE